MVRIHVRALDKLPDEFDLLFLHAGLWSVKFKAYRLNSFSLQPFFGDVAQLGEH